MKLFLLSFLSCIAIGVLPAYGTTSDLAPREAATASKSLKESPRLKSSASKNSRLNSSVVRSNLDLTPPVEVAESSPIGSETIRTLASGDAPVSPWFPGKGAIGVRMKVTW